jgi:hypothetical protein
MTSASSGSIECSTWNFSIKLFRAKRDERPKTFSERCFDAPEDSADSLVSGARPDPAISCCDRMLLTDPCQQLDATCERPDANFLIVSDSALANGRYHGNENYRTSDARRPGHRNGVG